MSESDKLPSFKVGDLQGPPRVKESKTGFKPPASEAQVQESMGFLRIEALLTKVTQRRSVAISIPCWTPWSQKPLERQRQRKSMRWVKRRAQWKKPLIYSTTCLISKAI